jgi:hypothetical protein
MKDLIILSQKPLVGLAGILLWMFCFGDLAIGQRNTRNLPQIASGTTIPVRTTEEIETNSAGDKVYSGVVDSDVMGRNRTVLIPWGSDVELVVREVTVNDDDRLAVDLAAINIRGQRYGLETEESIVTDERRQGIGVNKRTGKYVGGGAVVGAIIGAITGGGKGAAIGAGAGAAAGAGAQVLTRGDKIDIPTETLLTFRVQQPLYPNSGDISTSSTSAAYQAGLRAGRADWDRNLPRDPDNERYTTAQQRRDYEAGYNRGYSGEFRSDRYPSTTATRANIEIGSDNLIRWNAPQTVRVYVRVDNNARQLFAEGPSGAQEAPWIVNGHNYVFVVEDMNGNELARDHLDLRYRR